MKARTVTQVVLVSLVLVALSTYSLAVDDPVGIPTSGVEQAQSIGYADSCDCGNADCDSGGLVDIGDVIEVIDHFFLKPIAEDTSAANVDHCDGLDMADVVLYLEHDRQDYTCPSFCSGTVDCEYAPEGDTVELVVARTPIAEIGDHTLQLDLYVRNHQRLAGAHLLFSHTWDHILIDSVATYGTFDSAFYYLSVYWYAGQMPCYGPLEYIAAEIPSEGLGLEPDSSGKRLWASYYLTIPEWTETDSIVFDAVPGKLKLVRSPYDGSSADSLGYRPAWSGPLVVRDLWHNCCGRYTGGRTGNCDCSPDGKITLSDITCIINRVYYIWPEGHWCCPANNNTNGSWDDGVCKVTLSDITKLIDAVYIRKSPHLLAECIEGCD